ncbi:MAG: DUF3990 domain-containing protein [Betaproteobacteria bacterium]|nr:MAG: DUF3990 domain-containing protein [Betaproteobacteria bacterium]
MSWMNSELILYHGCDWDSADAICRPSSTFPVHSINLMLCTPHTDFGKGFYATTNLHQAKNWANDRTTLLRITDPQKFAAVVEIAVEREHLAANASVLCFVTEGSAATSDFWEFIKHCRTGSTTSGHELSANKKDRMYDLVFGPVSLWTQTLVIKDCDQISFHTQDALKAIKKATVKYQCTQTNPHFIV